jgi:hypothetical protein
LSGQDESFGVKVKRFIEKVVLGEVTFFADDIFCLKFYMHFKGSFGCLHFALGFVKDVS